jgi:hypothetical protein
MRRVKLAIVLSTLFTATGCDLVVKSFAGSIIQMSIDGARELPPDQHLELWARTANDDVVRISTIYSGLLDPFDPSSLQRFRYPVTERTEPGSPPYSYETDPRGFVIRPVVRMGDPCMIDELGRLLTKAEAYEPKTVNGILQSAEEQAAQVRLRIAQVTGSSSCDDAAPVRHCGRQDRDLLGVLSFTSSTVPSIPYDAPPEERLRRCHEYWKDPLAYTPNPAQLTAPIHGPIWGYIDYTTLVPPSGFNSTRLDTAINLRGIRELFATIETLDAGDLAADPPRPDGVDPLNRGPVYFQGYPSVGGAGVVNIVLTGVASGHASLLVDLDADPIGF